MFFQSYLRLIQSGCFLAQKPMKKKSQASEKGNLLEKMFFSFKKFKKQLKCEIHFKFVLRKAFPN